MRVADPGIQPFGSTASLPTLLSRELFLLAIPGYHGLALRIDVTDGSSESRELGETTLRQYIGGAGLGTWLLLREASWATQPLDPASPLVFALSPLVGSPLTTSAKFAVVSKSPLTHRLNDSLASSSFAMTAKRCGCDALVVVGKADALSLLVIDNGQIRLENATDLQGLGCADTQQAVAQRLGAGYDIAVIGPAGEQCVPFATISHSGRHAGRGGSGAVMGSKNLKAIAVRGQQSCKWAHPDQLARFARELSQRSFGPATAKYRELGTATNLLAFNRLNTLPTRNFQGGHFEQADRIAPEQLTTSRQRTRAHCASCTIGCEQIYGLKEGTINGPGVRIEYENLFALGPMLGIGDPEMVLAASRKCDELGLDTISAGGTIAFAMECVQRGFLDEPELTFGNGPLVLDLLDLIARRSGIGERLAVGSRQLAAELGKDAESIAPHVKGLELPGYEPRGLQTMALGFAVGTRGADHNRSGAYEADFSAQVDRLNVHPTDAPLAADAEDRAALIDSLILCKFLRGVFTDLFTESAEMLRLTTGWDMTADELRTAARRIVTARKLYNQRAGWDPAEDTLPTRLLEEPLPENPNARLTADKLRSLVIAYNRHRGWTDQGHVPPQQLLELDLDNV